MCLTGSLLRNVLMVLLLTSCCGKRRCNYTEILESYRDIVLTELRFLNLTASVNSPKTRDICPSGKAHHILASIYGATLQMQCHRSWEQLSDLEKPLKTMKELITDNCNLDDLRKKTVSCSSVRKIRGKKRMKISFHLPLPVNMDPLCFEDTHPATDDRQLLKLGRAKDKKRPL